LAQRELAFLQKMRDDTNATFRWVFICGRHRRKSKRSLINKECGLRSKASTILRLSGIAVMLCLTLGYQSSAQSTTPGKPAQKKATAGKGTSKKPSKASANRSISQKSVAKTNSTASRSGASAHPKTSTRAATRNASSKSASLHRVSKKKRKPRGQQQIDPERANEIQEALIREHYLSGEPAGTWDASSEAAMRRYQEDHGWQSKTVPDARALISLGLGPKHDHLLNPESAMTTDATAPAATSLTPASHSAEPGPTSSTPNTTAEPHPAQSSDPGSTDPQ
jgi:hypothetical protein